MATNAASENTTTKPGVLAVDVMAVLSSDAAEADWSHRRAGSPYAAELKRDSETARAAVKQMAEGADKVLAALDEADAHGYSSMSRGEMRATLRAALAAFRGEDA